MTSNVRFVRLLVGLLGWSAALRASTPWEDAEGKSVCYVTTVGNGGQLMPHSLDAQGHVVYEVGSDTQIAFTAYWPRPADIGRDDIRQLSIDSNADSGAPRCMIVRLTRRDTGEPVSIKVYSTGEGKNLTMNQCEMWFTIPNTEAIITADVRRVLDVARSKATGLQLALLKSQPVSQPAFLKVMAEDVVDNPVGTYELRCEYHCSKRENPAGVVNFPPVVITIVDRGSSFDHLLDPKQR